MRLDNFYEQNILFLKQNFSVEDQKQLDNKWTSFPESLEVEGKQDQLFPVGSVTKCFVITPNWKLKKTAQRLFSWHLLAQQICHIFKMRSPYLIMQCSVTASSWILLLIFGAICRHNREWESANKDCFCCCWVRSLSCRFPRELVSFVHYVTYMWHVLLQLQNIFELGGITKWNGA